MVGGSVDISVAALRARRERARTAAVAARLDALLGELRAGEPRPGDWLSRLVDLLRPARRESAAHAVARLHGLLRRLEAEPELGAALGRLVAAPLAARMHRILYADSGVLANEGFLGGLARRAVARLLPAAPDAHYLRGLIAEVFDHPRDHAWLAAVPREDWDALFAALGVDGPAFEDARRRCRHELREAMRLASVRLAALGTDPALLQYLPALARHESPFLAQADEVRRLIELPAAGGAGADDRHLDVLLTQCSDYVEQVRRRSRASGVAVHLVFLLARIEQVVARLHLLRGLVQPAAGRGAQVAFLRRLVRQENRRNSLRDLLSGTTELLARRVTEQASRSGEHYITASRSEFFDMFRAAAGAGLVIAPMALLKIEIARLGLPLLWEAVAFSLNYGLGFVLIHVLHMTIATKQPAMTAATLAAALDGRDSREARLEAITHLAAEVSRTQWISIAGNVSVALITAFAIALTTGRFLGWDPVSPEKAAHLLHDLHPWQSLALLHAAIAGVYLFLSGLVSGYCDNLSLYHRVPERLRCLKRAATLLGRERLDRLAGYVEHNLGALAGNFLFGCMLGSTPVLGELLGLPLDIRHVAFASANLAYGLEGLEFAVTAGTVLVAALGVLLVGLTNLVVSFSLALRVALRSRGIPREETEGLWGRVLGRALERPRDFVWPPARETA